MSVSPQPSLDGSLSCLPIIKNHLIRPNLFGQEDRFALARLKVTQFPG